MMNNKICFVPRSNGKSTTALLEVLTNAQMELTYSCILCHTLDMTTMNDCITCKQAKAKKALTFLIAEIMREDDMKEEEEEEL